MKNYLRLKVLFCPFTSNLFVNVKLHSALGNVPKLTKFFLQKCDAYLRAALKVP